MAVEEREVTRAVIVLVTMRSSEEVCCEYLEHIQGHDSVTQRALLLRKGQGTNSGHPQRLHQRLRVYMARSRVCAEIPRRPTNLPVTERKVIHAKIRRRTGLRLSEENPYLMNILRGGGGPGWVSYTGGATQMIIFRYTLRCGASNSRTHVFFITN
ncbi:hypothetical protein PUN28_003782 [Cardiocondyla obscurior]|uniref:Uncharacterized protein n=1 Tax=Cardiocondyla obscurior TaxID=286306 RepID=A0AAW2GK91_9HYME